MNQTRIETYTLAHKADLWVSDCPECGVVFGIPNAMRQRRFDDGGRFYCPNGHTMSWHETAEDRAKKRAELAERRLATRQAQLDQATADANYQRRRVAAAKGQATKIRKRIANGVCPCCNRSFANVARHMAGQHPDYVAPLPAPLEMT